MPCEVRARPSPSATVGRLAKIAIITACRAKMPKFSCISRRFFSTSLMREGWVSASWRSLLTVGLGVTSATTATAARHRKPVSANRPGTPTKRVSTGPSTMLAAKVRPMVSPTEAIARVRTSSRVRSASSAVTAALTAPAPCTARPIISRVTLSAIADRKLPSANTASPR